MPPVRPGQVSLLWVISHPDRLTAARCDTYDVVFVASPRFRDLLAEVTTTPVVTLLQATDPERFHPEPGGPAHDLLFVGNSRGVRRPIIDALAGSGLDLAVYGGGWTAKLLDPARLRGEWIPNHQLRRYSASAAIVLSDHWRDMREEGFISNRVFDVLASGGFLISDRVAGLDEEFDGAVVTWAEGEDLDALAASWLARPEERRSRADRGRAIVVERHTFAQRVDVLIATATPLLEGSMVRSRADAP
jgi:spore maturation protein CgeB